jgi:LuxR family maltose regulon positive regulatory protein
MLESKGASTPAAASSSAQTRGRVDKPGRRTTTSRATGAPGDATGENFVPPRPAKRTIPRTRLVGLLRDEIEHRAVLVQAPAGYGKTTMLAQWADRDGRPFAWVSAGRCGNDPARLAELLFGALEHLRRTQAKGSRRAKLSGSPGLEDLAAAADKLSAHGEAVVVVDDVHRLQSDRSLQLLGSFVREAPQALRIALAARGEPALGLTRMRAAGELLSLDSTDLCMDLYESQELLRGLGVELGEEETMQLLQQSEGWPAGIHLTGEALHASRAGVGGGAVEETNHAVAQYVREEMLQTLSPDARAMLVRTAILDQLSGPVCDAVAEQSGSGRTLQQLVAAGLMLVPLDSARSWFRCHTMLRDVLRADLDASEPSGIRPMHARASSWFQGMGDMDAALEHAFAAHDTDGAATLLWAHAAQYLYGRDDLVQGWLSGLTPEEIGGCPGLALAAAHSHLALGDAASARHWERVAAESMAPDNAAGLSPMAAAGQLVELATTSYGTAECAAAAERLALDPQNAGAVRPLALLLQGVALLLQGDREAAAAPLSEAADACAGTTPWIEAIALTELALDAVEDGTWERAGDCVDEALATLRAHGLDEQAPAALTHAAAALVMSATGAADGAKRELVVASRQLERLGRHAAWYELQARVALARAYTRLADVGRARSLLAQASRLARGPHAVPLFVTWLDNAWGEIDDVGAAALNGPGSLTMAELRVLRFLPSHLSFREIGERLHVSPNTVKSQAHATYAKLGAASRTEAVAHAAALGLVDAPIV